MGSKGQYVVYERASRDEERLFLETAKEVIDEEIIREPKNREKRKSGGGRPFTYEFKPMLLLLLLMVYHGKEYREMESHLKNNPSLLLKELGLKKAPSKSTIHRAARRVSISTLVNLNDAVVAKFKKTMA